MRIQKPVKNRQRVSAGLIKEVNREVEKLMMIHDASRSFVISHLLAKILGVKAQEKL